MPPVSQGSRTTAVVWSVITGIAAVVATCFAIYFYVDSTKANQKADDTARRYNEIISAGDLTSQQVTDLKAMRGAEGSQVAPTAPVFNVLTAQRNELAKMLAGPNAADSEAARAVPAARAALAKAAPIAKEANINIPTADDLAQAVSNLTDGIRTLLQLNKDLNAQLADAKKQMAEQVKQFDQSRAEMNQTVEQIRAEQQKTLGSFTTYQGQKNASVAEIENAVATERAAAQEAMNKAQLQLVERQRTIEKLTQDLNTLKEKLAPSRLKTGDPVLRQADGKIVRIPTRESVYIDLGSADSITPGLSFEVYDKFEGIPAPGDPADDENLPKGKASIEVTRVFANSAECRIVRQTPGTQLTEGDLIANLVYDPNTKYTFMVFGDFDVDRNGQPSPQETDVIKRLVTQWGGLLSEQVNVDTDFVVLGKEPVLPSFSREELQDPFNAKKLADAQAALDQYLNVKKQAVDLHIPVLNQNRFLYLIGHYAQASR